MCSSIHVLVFDEAQVIIILQVSIIFIVIIHYCSNIIHVIVAIYEDYQLLLLLL